MEQREGRIIRQGNTNPKVYVYRYVTEGTFDGYLYQTIESKQRGISQILSSKIPPREFIDIDETVLNYTEVKALCENNPLIRENIELDVEVKRLSSERSNYKAMQYGYETDLKTRFAQKKAAAEKRIKCCEEDIKRLGIPPEERKFKEITVNGEVYTERKKGGEALIKAIYAVGSSDRSEIGRFLGYRLSTEFTTFGDTPHYVLRLHGVIVYDIEASRDANGIITRLENCLQKQPEFALESAKRRLDEVNNEILSAEEIIKKPWSKEE